MNNLLDRKKLPGDSRIVALGGGVGGAGRSTLATDLARLLTRRGQRVLLVDADVGAPSLHLRLDIDLVSQLPGREPFREDGPFHTVIVPGDRTRPALLPIGITRPRAFGRCDIRATRFVRALRDTQYETVVIDLPAAPDPVWSTVFALADVPILLSTTEGPALHAATRYLRAALIYAVLVHPEAEPAEFELVRAIETLPLDADIENIRRGFGSSRLRTLLDSTLTRFEPYLALAQTREVAERELGHAIAYFWGATLGVWPRVLGHTEFDERRWFQVRHEARSAATDIANAEASADALARTLANLETLDDEQPRSAASVATPCARLGLSPNADAVVLRQSYRRLWEAFRRDSPFATQLVGTRTRDVLLAELEDANRDLQRWLIDRPAAPEVAEAPRPPQRSHPGDQIRAARQRRNLGQRELSLQTKIGLRYLEAIEQFELDELPRPVYLRGYLREIALALDLPPEPLMDDYLTALNETRSSRILTRSGATSRDRQ
ncbi:MAG: helix-turn-helix domain-containing protein [Myxococcales bacterium]|nr:helix-turn-helix domain-containing protein [Myxococcales bacterium]